MCPRIRSLIPLQHAAYSRPYRSSSSGSQCLARLCFELSRRRLTHANILLVCIMYMFVPAATCEAQTPGTEQLYSQWQDWAISVRDYGPRRTESTATGNVVEMFGYSSELMEVYRSGPLHYALKCERIPRAGEVQKGAPYFVVISDSRYFATITRDSEKAEWRINRADKPIAGDQSRDPFLKFCQLPGTMRQTRASLEEIYETRVVRENRDQVVVEFSVKNPKQEFYGTATSIVDLFEVTFSRKYDWLPYEFRRRHQFQEGHFWRFIRFEQFADVDGLLIPRRIDEWLGRDDSGELVESQVFHEIVPISVSVVDRETDLTRYQLPQMDLRPESSFRWWYVVAAAVVVVAGITTRRRARSSG